MSTTTTQTPTASGKGIGNLAKVSLYAPRLQTTPLPIRAIPPAPCTQSCPAGINVKAYLSLIAEERFSEALEVVRRHCPLPGICGRICHAPCELTCNRNEVDDPVAIRALKRFIADMEPQLPAPPPLPPAVHSERIAIIGSGPAGLTAAYDLRRAGYPVTVFEAEDEAGGMLRYGIAEYRLPRDILDAEINVMLQSGIEIQTGKRLGRDMEIEDLMQQGYRAVLLAMGAQIGRRMGLPGENESPEVEDALAFLRRANAGDRTPVGKRIVVIGGGSTAIEAARMSRRLGAESVEILYRRSPQEVLASQEEVEAAKAEGVRFRFLVAPKRVLTDGDKFVGIECLQVALGEEDRSGRRRPIQIPGTEFPVHADRVFAAVGQEVDLGFLPSRGRTRLTDNGTLFVDDRTAMTRLSGVFAAGDMVTGPDTVIAAIAAGHDSATSIRQLIEEGSPGIPEGSPERTSTEFELPDMPPADTKRIHPATGTLRAGEEFGEVEQCFTQEQAVAEARRCQRCGPCSECRICATTCQRRHLTVRAKGADAAEPPMLVRASVGTVLSLDNDSAASGWLLPTTAAGTMPNVNTADGLEVDILPARAHILTARCRACSACVEVCPFDAVQVIGANGLAPHAEIEPALCRGCNLCTAVCSTDAALPVREPLVGWNGAADLVAGAETTHVVLTCEKRAASLEALPQPDGVRLAFIRLRCVGEVESGMLVDLVRRGAGQVLVGGCGTERCHYGKGAGLAAEQVKAARDMLRLLGFEEGCIAEDWSLDRSQDPLHETIARLGTAPDAPRPVAS